MSEGSPSRQPSRGWRRATLAGAALALLIMAHYGWFTVLGPPARWGTGVVTVDPTIERADAAAIQPGDRWAPDRAATFPARLSTVALDGVQGKPFELDVAGDDGMGVLQTFAGPSWTQGQRLYVRSGAAAPWRELTLPPGLMLSDACLVRPGGRPAVLVSAWQPWWPYERSYGRFVRSVLDRALRPEHAIYLLDLDGGGMRFLFPGEGLTLSPDRRTVAYVTSENDHAGLSHHRGVVGGHRDVGSGPVPLGDGPGVRALLRLPLVRELAGAPDRGRDAGLCAVGRVATPEGPARLPGGGAPAPRHGALKRVPGSGARRFLVDSLDIRLHCRPPSTERAALVGPVQWKERLCP